MSLANEGGLRRKILVSFAKTYHESYGSGSPSRERLEPVLAAAPKSWEFILPKQTSESELKELIKDADAVLGSTHMNKTVIEAATKLKIIQATGSGTDSIDIPLASKKGIYVCNMPGQPASWVAEHTFGLILAVTKHITIYDKEIRSGRWVPIPSVGLKGKTLGIIGLGPIGSAVAKLGKAFEMKTVAIKRTPSEEIKKELDLDFLGSPNDLPYLLKESNIIVIAVPLNDSSRGMIGAKQFELMKKDAIIISISRGGILDEAALLNALRNRQIGGAGLDVFEDEPIEGSNPLLEFDNVVVTPHVAGGQPDPKSEEWKNRMHSCVRNIELVFSGKAPTHLINGSMLNPE